MFLRSISLANFRNYSQIYYNFSSPLTILLGNNAQGKSNFLESIYFLSTTKSPKAEKDEELIKKGESVLRVEGEVSQKSKVKSQNYGNSSIPPIFHRSHSENNNNESYEISLEIAMQSIGGSLTKRVRVNGIGRRVLDYIGNLAVVSFSPEDINLVTGPPALRRWHIDLTLAQIDKEYKNALTSYEEVLRNKNKLLKKIKEGLAKVLELDYWLALQLGYGQIVAGKRRIFFEFINSVEKKFGPPTEGLKFEYVESYLDEARLKDYQSREIASSSSLIGPHRDDFRFVMNGTQILNQSMKQVQDKVQDGSGRDLSHFGSRGEHRTAVLDLKISEVSFIESVLGSRPILLLDDIFSELDLIHREHVLNLIPLQQTILATVDLDDFLKGKLKEGQFVRVEDGKLQKYLTLSFRA